MTTMTVDCSRNVKQLINDIDIKIIEFVLSDYNRKPKSRASAVYGGSRNARP